MHDYSKLSLKELRHLYRLYRQQISIMKNNPESFLKNLGKDGYKRQLAAIVRRKGLVKYHIDQKTTDNN